MSTGEYRYIPPKPPTWFNVAWLAGFGAVVGLLTAQGNFSLFLPYLAVGAVLFGLVGLIVPNVTQNRPLAGFGVALLFFLLGWQVFSFAYGVLIGIVGYFIGRMSLWLSSGNYRLNLPPYATAGEVLWFYTFRTICGLIFLFLITPIIILIPLSFNQVPYFSFTPGMLK